MTVEMPKRRAWFQLHLSTCVVLMVVAGALIWANLTPPTATLVEEGTYSIREGKLGTSVTRPAQFAKIRGPGWPIISYTATTRLDPPSTIQSPDQAIKYLEESWGSDRFRYQEFSTAAQNFAIALAILALTAIACEYLIRRRARIGIPRGPAP